MGIYNDVVITGAGITLLRNAALPGYALNAARAVTSSMVISNPQQAASIPGIVQNQSYSLYPMDDNQFVLDAQLTNTGVATAYEVNTIGFFANDGVGTDVLLAVITAQSADLMPSENSYPMNMNFKAVIVVDGEGTIAVKASFAGYASLEDLQVLKGDVEDLVDKLSTNVGSSSDAASASGTSLFSLVKFLTGAWTAAKAALLDVAISSRAAAADWTAARAAKVDNLDAKSSDIKAKTDLIGASSDTANASGTTLFSRINRLITDLSTTRAGYLDAAISTRAAASTALSNAVWTNVRAGYLDKLASVVTEDVMAQMLAAAGGIKSVQRGTTSEAATVTITAVDMSKAFVISASKGSSGYVAARGTMAITGNSRATAGGSGGVGGNSAFSGTGTLSGGETDLTVKVYSAVLSATNKITCDGPVEWQLIEFR